jgi:hypothetical protein
MTNELSITHSISSKIHTVRGIKVMLDSDLANLYQVTARALRQQVKRNPDRFPSDFIFQLTKAESEDMVSQNVTPSMKHFGGALPYAFTEQGVAMLSSVLKSKISETTSAISRNSSTNSKVPTSLSKNLMKESTRDEGLLRLYLTHRPRVYRSDLPPSRFAVPFSGTHNLKHVPLPTSESMCGWIMDVVRSDNGGE